jgi:hypothetical protein
LVPSHGGFFQHALLKYIRLGKQQVPQHAESKILPQIIRTEAQDNKQQVQCEWKIVTRNYANLTSLRLLPNENVEWTTRKGFFSFSLILAFFGMIGGVVLAAFGFMGGQSNGQPVSPSPVLGWMGVALMLAGLGYVAFSFLATKSTSYVLTNQRILETRSGKIVKETALADFMGNPISQFLDKQAAGTVNQQPVYNVRIINPRTLDHIEFKSLNESAVGALERILERARQVVRCEYCKTNNSAASFLCSHCGAPLP